MPRRNYDRQFKMAAVKLVLNEDVSVSEAAKELCIHYNTLYQWINEYDKYGESAFPGNGCALYSLEYENKKLLKEKEELRKQLDALKKFQACLKKKKI